MPAPAIHGRLCRDSPAAGFLPEMRGFVEGFQSE
jgi:hypothetical protein